MRRGRYGEGQRGFALKSIEMGSVQRLEHDGVAVVCPGQTYVGQQGFTYGAGCSEETVGAAKIA